MSERVIERISKTIAVIMLVVLFYFMKSYNGFESAVFVGLSLALVELWYMSSQIKNKEDDK